MESKKSHSWWWDSHISPKNSKWLAENLEGKHMRNVVMFCFFFFLFLALCLINSNPCLLARSVFVR